MEEQVEEKIEGKVEETVVEKVDEKEVIKYKIVEKAKADRLVEKVERKIKVGFEDVEADRVEEEVNTVENETLGEQVVGREEVTSDINHKEEVEELTAEKVVEKRKYVKTSRVCQFFNIC